MQFTNKTIRVAVALTAVALAATAAVSQTAPATDLTLVTSHLKSVATMTAAFVQTDRAGKALTGTMTLKRPGKIRFGYQKGVPLLIVSDGRALTFIDYSVRQVQRWPIGNSPLGVLLDANKELARFARIVPSNDKRLVIVEARDPKKPEYGITTLAFSRDSAAPAGLMLQGWVTLDAQGNRTSIRLSGQRFNVAVSDETFRWRDPRPASRGR